MSMPTGNGENPQFYGQWTDEVSQNGLCAKSLQRQRILSAWIPGLLTNTGFSATLIGICETFLREDNEIHLEGYTWLGNNRKQISKRAIRGSGGVGLLVKDTVFHKFIVSV